LRFDHALDDLLSGRSNIRVLRALDELPDGLAVSARELARRSGLSHPTVSKVLASLTSQGVTVARRAPRADAFELNRRHVLVEQIEPLFEWERQLLQELLAFLRREIEREAPEVSAAYLFGSVVRGQARPGSDIDLAVIAAEQRDLGDLEAGLSRVAKAFRGRFGNRLEVIARSSPIGEHQRPGAAPHQLWARIRRDGIPVIDRSKAQATPLPKKRSANA